MRSAPARDLVRLIKDVARRAISYCSADRSHLLVRERGHPPLHAAAGAVRSGDGDLQEVAIRAEQQGRPVRQKTLLAVPFRVRPTFTGALCLERRNPPFARSDLERVRFLLDFATTALENVALRSQVLTDRLTGLCTPDYFRKVLEREMTFSRKNDGRLALILLDIDNFSELNRTKGRKAADAVLSEVARRTARTLQAAGDATAHRLDLWLETQIGRFGGDEFAIQIPGISRDTAMELTQQLLKSLREAHVDCEGEPISISATAGIAVAPEDAETAEKLLIKAYHALYVAKVNGKDQAWTYGIEPGGQGARLPGGEELMQTPRGRRLASLLVNISQEDRAPGDLIRKTLRRIVEAIPARRARFVLFDAASRPIVLSAHGHTGKPEPPPTEKKFAPECIRVVLEAQSRTVGVLELEAGEHPFGPEEYGLIRMFAVSAGPVLLRAQSLHEARERLEQLEDLLRRGPAAERQQRSLGRIVACSRPMQDLLALIEKVAAVEYPVIISGETGAGKELVAKAIHHASRRRSGPFVPINCAAVSETLMESELFGHEKGAFTGADRSRPGLFQSSAGGTLLLDEIEEMPNAMQRKLLRVLEENRVRPVGAKDSVPVDVRILASANRPVQDLVREGKLREDLYYRLSTFILEVPPLRERQEDIPGICEALLEEIARESNGPARSLSPTALRILVHYPWPGNVRELRNELRKAYVLCNGYRITDEHLSETLKAPRSVEAVGTYARALREFERSFLLRSMQAFEWNISKAARCLGLARNTLKSKLRSYHLKPPPDRRPGS